MQTMLNILCSYLQQGKSIVLVTIVSQTGSTPRTAGSKMLVDASGLVWGTVGGGLAEGQAIEAALKLLTNNDQLTQSLSFDMSGNSGGNKPNELLAGADMVCGGSLTYWLELINASSNNLSFFNKLSETIRAGQSVYLISTMNENPQRSLILNDNTSYGASIADEIKQQIISNNKALSSQSLVVANKEYLYEKYQSPAQLIIVGGGHVSRPTAQIASLCGFMSTVIDDRAEFVGAERFPWAAKTLCIPSYLNCFSKKYFEQTHNAFIVIITRGHAYDAEVLAQALETQAGYIGMIGSKQKRESVYNKLKAQGFAQEQLDKVFCPIGLKIKAETPEEIAVSIVAELVEQRSKLLANSRI